jgi:hypothetical protein
MRVTLGRVGAAIGAGALPLVPALGVAAGPIPIDGRDSRSVEFTFVKDGQEITCTVRGSSLFTVFEEPEEYTVLRGDTSIDPEQPGCAENVSLLTVTASWGPEPGDEPSRVAISHSWGGTTATVLANDEGRTGRIVVLHEATFACDAGFCRAATNTLPK